MFKKTFIDKLILLIIFPILISHSVFSQSNFNKTPKLVVGIVIEEMRYEMLMRYWNSFENDGFKKIIDNGAFCTNAQYNHLITQNGVGQATIVTGTNPSYHGIIADTWYDRLSNRIINCAIDPKKENNNYGTNYSPVNILGSTIGDEIKLAFNGKSKVITVSLNPISAVLSGGRLADCAYWFNDDKGEWVTSDYYTDTLPGWVKDFNSKKFSDIYMSKTWASIYSLDENYKNSLPDNSNFELGFQNYRRTFPYDLAYLKNKSGNFKYLKYSPFGNTYTKDMAISAIVNEQMGLDEYPDFISISFSATKYVGDIFGPRSVEIEDVFLQLDKDLSHLIEFLKTQVGLENVLLYITSDRGVSDVPEYLESKKQNAGIFDGPKSTALLNSYLGILYKEGEWINYYHSRQLYINQQLLDETGIKREEVQERIANFMVQYTGVANALPASSFNSTYFESGINEKIQNSFHQKRSGDVILNLEPGWIEKNGSATASGSGYNYDTHVPLIWFGTNIPHIRIDDEVNITDIAPTISWMLKINKPNTSIGKPISKFLK